MRQLNKYWKKKLLKMKSKAEVLGFGLHMFKSLQSFNNSQLKLTPYFICQTYS